MLGRRREVPEAVEQLCESVGEFLDALTRVKEAEIDVVRTAGKVSTEAEAQLANSTDLTQQQAAAEAS